MYIVASISWVSGEVGLVLSTLRIEYVCNRQCTIITACHRRGKFRPSLRILLRRVVQELIDLAPLVFTATQLTTIAWVHT